jgi:hypothetical protein
VKKRLKNFLISVILGSTIGAYADTLNSLIGIEAKYHAANEVVSLYNSSSSALGVRLGASNDEYRILLMYDFIQDSDEQASTVTLSQYLVTANFDVFIPVSFKVKPFIGAIVGQGSYTLENSTQVISKETGWIYGGEIGLLYTLKGKPFDIDLTVRYLTGLDHVKDYVQAGIGINYKF